MYKLKSNLDFFTGESFKHNLNEALAYTKQPDNLSDLFLFLLTNSLTLVNDKTKKEINLFDARAGYSILFLFEYQVRLYLYDVLYNYELEIANKYRSPYKVRINAPSIGEVILLSTNLLGAQYPIITDRYNDTKSLNNLFSERVDSPSDRNTIRDRIEYVLDYFSIDVISKDLYNTFLRIVLENSRYYAGSLICNYFVIPEQPKLKILNSIETWLSQNTRY